MHNDSTVQLDDQIRLSLVDFVVFDFVKSRLDIVTK